MCGSDKELDLPFAENLVRSLAFGVLTNLGSNAAILAVFALGEALKIMPGPGTVASYTVLSSAVYAATIAAGYIYMKALANFFDAKGSEQIEEPDLKAAVDEVMKDKKSVQSIFETAKEGYIKDDSNLSSLAQELSELKQEMQKNAVILEQVDAVEEIAAAEIAAQRNDASKTFKRAQKSWQVGFGERKQA